VTRNALEIRPANRAFEKQLAPFHAQLMDSTFYARDPGGTAMSERVEDAQNAPSLSEERWLNLAILLEELRLR
jgi:hypothetical protein